MTSGNDFDPFSPQQVLFAARLTPHRSLNRTSFLVLMTFLSLISFTAGVAFLLMGAWPVFGFFGLDVLAIYWAFRINFRRARAYEDVRVSYSELRLRRVSHRGHAMEWAFNPLWVQVVRKTHLDKRERDADGEPVSALGPRAQGEAFSHPAPEFGIERLYLVSRGQRISLGSFLGPDEKERFYNALIAAIGKARRGPTYNPVV